MSGGQNNLLISNGVSRRIHHQSDPLRSGARRSTLKAKPYRRRWVYGQRWPVETLPARQRRRATAHVEHAPYRKRRRTSLLGWVGLGRVGVVAQSVSPATTAHSSWDPLLHQRWKA